MAKIRPIDRELFSDDIGAYYELAVHSKAGTKSAPNRPSGPRVSAPALSGTRIRRSTGGASFSPANGPQPTATGGNQNPPFGTGS